MGFSEADIRNVREQTDLRELVQEHLSIKRSGVRWKGLCPFHDEKTPSFSVTEDYFYCFGCEAKGDAIDFVQEMENLGFPDAVRLLAERVGVTLHPTGKHAEEETSTHRLTEVCEAASTWFGERLMEDEGTPGRDLLLKRHFDPASSVEQFGLGFAPNGGLLRHLKNQGFPLDLIVEAGLAIKGDRGAVREVFRNRLIWTIRSPFGKAIGFGARKMRDDDPIKGKFINTTETPIYKKSQVLYGLDLARRTAAKQGQMFVVEGYTDVMAMQLAGVPNTVATCGTSLTTEHLKVLRRTVGAEGEVVFCFDGDNAGRKAAMSAYDAARSVLHKMSCLTFPDGSDPDEVRQKVGDEALRDMTRSPRPLIETVLIGTIDAGPLDTPEERRVALDRALPILGHIYDPFIRQDYSALVAKKLECDTALVIENVVPPEPKSAPEDSDHSGPPSSVRGDLIQALLHSREAAAEHLSDARPFFSGSIPEQVFDALDVALWDDDNGRPWVTRIMSDLPLEAMVQVEPLLAERPPVPDEQMDQYVRELLGRLRENARETREDVNAVASASDPEGKAAALRALVDARKGSSCRKHAI